MVEERASDRLGVVEVYLGGVVKEHELLRMATLKRLMLE